MAHPCINCGGECFCNGDIDDCIVSKTPKVCESCGCDDDREREDWNDDDFIECAKCDGHDACRDFGCAYELGLGQMVQRNEF